MAVIELSELRYRWPKQTRDALYIPHLQVKQGEHLFIKGASGSGKTTLLNLLAGILTPSAGSIQLLGQALERLSGRGGIAYVLIIWALFFSSLIYCRIYQCAKISSCLVNFRRNVNAKQVT